MVRDDQPFRASQGKHHLDQFVNELTSHNLACPPNLLAVGSKKVLRNGVK